LPLLKPSQNLLGLFYATSFPQKLFDVKHENSFISCVELSHLSNLISQKNDLKSLSHSTMLQASTRENIQTWGETQKNTKIDACPTFTLFFWSSTLVKRTISK